MPFEGMDIKSICTEYAIACQDAPDSAFASALLTAQIFCKQQQLHFKTILQQSNKTPSPMQQMLALSPKQHKSPSPNPIQHHLSPKKMASPSPPQYFSQQATVQSAPDILPFDMTEAQQQRLIHYLCIVPFATLQQVSFIGPVRAKMICNFKPFLGIHDAIGKFNQVPCLGAQMLEQIHLHLNAQVIQDW